MEDEENLRDVVMEMLKHLGHEPETAQDGLEAIEKFKLEKASGKPFVLVILDLTVRGGMGGKETVRRLIELDPGVKAFVSTGYATDRIMSRCREYGFVGSRCKPYQLSNLSEVFRTTIKNQEGLQPDGCVELPHSSARIPE